ncbi:MAG TPA: glycosyltransferase family 2 protein [Clostridiales bacterium]|nr:glycosyltransferase family 2 protein [Clostridiales bacterium]
MDNAKTVSAIIPAYNEEANIVQTIKALKKLDLINEIIVVDDSSKDNTLSLALKENVRVIGKKTNKGKGHSLRVGYSYCRGDIVLFVDADLKDTAHECKKLLIPILDDKGDVAIARFPDNGNRDGFGLVNRFAQFLVKRYTGKHVESVLSGQRAFKRLVLEDIGIRYNRFGVEVGMTIDIINNNYRLLEIDVQMDHQHRGKSLKGFIHRTGQLIDILRVAMGKEVVN